MDDVGSHIRDVPRSGSCYFLPFATSTPERGLLGPDTCRAQGSGMIQPWGYWRNMKRFSGQRCEASRASSHYYSVRHTQKGRVPRRDCRWPPSRDTMQGVGLSYALTAPSWTCAPRYRHSRRSTRCSADTEGVEALLQRDRKRYCRFTVS